MLDHPREKYIGTSGFVLALVSEWLEALQDARTEEEKNEYARKSAESIRVLQQLLDQINQHPVNVVRDKKSSN